MGRRAVQTAVLAWKAGADPVGRPIGPPCGSPTLPGLLRSPAWPMFDVADGQKQALPKRANARIAGGVGLPAFPAV
eukprot:4988473-Alexandrium_andersonii.AAC.1